MKETLKKVFNKKTSTPIFVGFGTFAILTFIVYPALTAADTILNIIGAIVGVFTLTFLFYYVDGDRFVNAINPVEPVEPGETELDYVSPEELKPKKKRAKVKKSEFPMPPHNSRKNKK